MADKILNIVIGDAQHRVRYGLRLLLELQPGWRVIGEAEDSSGLLEAIDFLCPDLVLLDWELPDIPANQLLTTMQQTCPKMQMIFMSGKAELRQAALQAGVRFFVYKADPPEKLLGLIRESMKKTQK
jgi:DNA-binding NarL/FixJ family response regulator